MKNKKRKTNTMLKSPNAHKSAKRREPNAKSVNKRG